MKLRYQVQVTYPDGTIKRFEEEFEMMSEAIEFGNKLLLESKDAYFYVVQITEDENKMVYDSKCPIR